MIHCKDIKVHLSYYKQKENSNLLSTLINFNYTYKKMMLYCQDAQSLQKFKNVLKQHLNSGIDHIQYTQCA